MLLSIKHKTEYCFSEPVHYGLQQLRLSPQSDFGQKILNWEIKLSSGKRELEYQDQHNNLVQLISLDTGTESISIECLGEVETKDCNGIVGKHTGHASLSFFKRQTTKTRAGIHIRKLIKYIRADDSIASFHELSSAILEKVEYKKDTTDSMTTAEKAASTGAGVCQDHAHIMITAARYAGYPARYVSGYMFMDDDEHHTASHAWAEIYIADIGWTGFDVSNGVSPDERYIRLATGLDADEATPVKGIRYGQQEEDLNVHVVVEQ